MKRSEFLKMCGVLGIGLPYLSTIAACSNTETVEPTGEKIIIIGAGAGGLASGYLLTQAGYDVQILEASSVYGGRMRRTTEFASFPIPLGAEWLHVERGIFDEIINDPSIPAEVQTTPYDMNEDYGLFEGMQISVEDVGFTIDQKFINNFEGQKCKND